MQPDVNTVLFFEGDQSAIKEVYRIMYKRCEDFILRKNGTVEDAKDCFQEAIISTYYTGREACLNGGISIKQYLFGALKKSWYKLWRKEYETDFFPEISFTKIPENELKQFVAMAFLKLKKECREIVSSYYLYDEKLKTIAEDQNRSYQNLKYRKSTCLDELRKLFFKYMESLKVVDHWEDQFRTAYSEGGGPPENKPEESRKDLWELQEKYSEMDRRGIFDAYFYNGYIDDFKLRTSKFDNDPFSEKEKIFFNGLFTSLLEVESGAFLFEPSDLEEGEINSQ